jgi:hypothetical protein
MNINDIEKKGQFLVLDLNSGYNHLVPTVPVELIFYYVKARC